MHHVLSEYISLHGRPSPLASRAASMKTNKAAYKHTMERRGRNEDVHFEIEFLWTVLHSSTCQKNEVVPRMFAEEIEKGFDD